MQAEHFAMATSFKAAEAALQAELASTNAKHAALEQATGPAATVPPPRSSLAFSACDGGTWG
jgi:hypothetical protein